jgi:hypothetical protein
MIWTMLLPSGYHLPRWHMDGGNTAFKRERPWSRLIVRAWAAVVRGIVRAESPRPVSEIGPNTTYAYVQAMSEITPTSDIDRESLDEHLRGGINSETSARLGFPAIHGLERGVRPEFRDVASRHRVRRDIQ